MQPNMLLGLVIRPPRSSYPVDAGVTLTATHGGILCKTDNFVINNAKGQKLHCSFTTQQNLDEGSKRPCIIYMHGNAGNKFEGQSYADKTLPLGVDLFTFDFSGCGNSEGQWVTLGWKEVDDLSACLNHLAQAGKTSKVALWGRSMGGSTALRFNNTTSPLPVTCMIVDSAFSRFTEVAAGMVSKIMPGMPPEAIMQMMWPSLCQMVNQETGGLDLNTLNPVESAP